LFSRITKYFKKSFGHFLNKCQEEVNETWQNKVSPNSKQAYGLKKSPAGETEKQKGGGLHPKRKKARVTEQTFRASLIHMIEKS
jgi:hypothetical protein